MTRFAFLLAGALAACPLALAAQETASENTETEEVTQIEPTADTVVATVNGTDITLGHLILIRATLPPEYQGLGDDVLFDGILDQLIQQTAVAKAGEAEDSLRLRLALENERRSILAAEALQAVADEAVTDEDVQAAYQEQYLDVPVDQEYNASHILVDTEDEAKALVADLAGGADFAELAREKSTGPSGPNGGQLGWFGKGAMVPPFEAAVVALEAGTVSDPVQTQFGWHVIRLNEVRDMARESLDAVRDELTAQLQDRAVRAYVDAEAATATVTRIDPATIDKSLISRTELLEP